MATEPALLFWSCDRARLLVNVGVLRTGFKCGDELLDLAVSTEPAATDRDRLQLAASPEREHLGPAYTEFGARFEAIVVLVVHGSFLRVGPVAWNDSRLSTETTLANVYARDRTTCKNVVVDDTTDWPAELMTRLGEAIADVRKSRGMSAVRLAEAMEEIGVPVHRVAIARMEAGKQVITVPELMALGAALNADWTGWLINAANGLPIPSERSERAGLRAALADLSDQLDTLQHNLIQAREGPKHLSMPDVLKEKYADDAKRYREMIKSLESRREVILKMLGGHDDA